MGDPSGAGGVRPRFSAQGWGNKRGTRGDISSIAQLGTIGSGLAFSCCSLHARPSSPAPALLFLPGGAAGAGSCCWMPVPGMTCPMSPFPAREGEDVRWKPPTGRLMVPLCLCEVPGGARRGSAEPHGVLAAAWGWWQGAGGISLGWSLWAEPAL